ncbi:nucleoside 2-deoxyribosyltransferase domain-containing protein [bacterium]|jgi:hypothetical protein|nr:nucleoside 2-deoxyribosyltransferase domain-containing protein [bacterium]
MAIIIEAPNKIYGVENNNNINLFLAGGISNCEDWQFEVCNELKNIENLTIYNPRRRDFDITDNNTKNEQITWEFKNLRDADIILFWFAEGSLNPTTLYEYGMWANSRNNVEIIVGIDPNYERKNDIIMQTQLAKPNKLIYLSLLPLVENLKNKLNKNEYRLKVKNLKYNI